MAAATLKHWRESASLIIASKRMAMLQPGKSFVNKLLRQQPQPVENTNEELMRILLLKRSSDSSFMPSVYVFPGGMLDNTDFAKEWLEIIDINNTSGKLSDMFTRRYPEAPIFSRAREAEFSSIPSAIALRIAAIRETFEESGVLIARPKSDLTDKSLFTSNQPSFGSVCNIPTEAAIYWRTKIISDSSQFVAMCKELEMVPDIWSLYEWSNWLTPPLRRTRFDTAFFITCIDEAPEATDSHETEHALWSDPHETLQACAENAFALAPPQIYEMSRLVRLNSVDELLKFAWKRSSSYGLARWMPIMYSCPDGILFVLPGDELYPENPDLTGESIPGPFVVKETVNELQKKYPQQHRAVIHKDKSISLHCNIEFVDGHMLPLQYDKSSTFQPRM